jgi:leucyl aminopeptidase (aminopeptidase T)
MAGMEAEEVFTAAAEDSTAAVVVAFTEAAWERITVEEATLATEAADTTADITAVATTADEAATMVGEVAIGATRVMAMAGATDGASE